MARVNRVAANPLSHPSNDEPPRDPAVCCSWHKICNRADQPAFRFVVRGKYLLFCELNARLPADSNTISTMKKSLALAIFLIAQLHATLGQEWFSPDSKWYYNCCGDLFQPTHLEVYPWHDTLLNGLSASFIRTVVHTRNLWTNQVSVYDYTPFIAREEDGVVYYWQKDFQDFDTLYHLNGAIGDTWAIDLSAEWLFGRLIATIIDTGTMSINEKALRWIEVEFLPDPQDSFWAWRDTVVETIGPLRESYFLPWHNLYLAGGAHNLRCFYSDCLGWHSRVPIEECAFVYTSTRGPDLEQQIKAYPNPARDALFVEIETAGSSQELLLELYDSYGRRLLRQAGRQPFELSLAPLPPAAIYLLLVKDGPQIVGLKRIVKQ